MRLFGNDERGSAIATLILLLITILIAASLITTISEDTNDAKVNVTIAGGTQNWTGTPKTYDAVPGGVSLLDLWPLLFIVAVVLAIVKVVFF